MLLTVLFYQKHLQKLFSSLWNPSGVDHQATKRKPLQISFSLIHTICVFQQIKKINCWHFLFKNCYRGQNTSLQMSQLLLGDCLKQKFQIVIQNIIPSKRIPWTLLTFQLLYIGSICTREIKKTFKYIMSKGFRLPPKDIYFMNFQLGNEQHGMIN